MSIMTNVEAHAVRTIDWLSAPDTTLAVPVYQRLYRWDINGCRRLLDDIRAVADKDEWQTHFIGSILATQSRNAGLTELALIDGHQRVSTLTLLLAALRQTVERSDPALAAKLKTMLVVHPTRADWTKLRPHKQGAGILESMVFDRTPSQEELAATHYDENYAFFLEEIGADGSTIWKGLQRLEHVAITLKEHANPQQIFESLNSTGTRLLNHELVHNYVLMGLSRAQQAEIEESYWIPIEANTGQAIDAFLRDYLVLRTGRDTDLAGERGVYDAWRAEYPQLRYEDLLEHAPDWMAYSEVYRILLDPTHAHNPKIDPEIARHLGYLNTFGTATYPLVMGIYRAYRKGLLDNDALVKTLEQIQALYLRKQVVGESREHLMAQLCRKWVRFGYPIGDLARRSPSDERVRRALRFQPLPYAGYVLQRLEMEPPPSLEGLQIEHIFPQIPSGMWSGDGGRQWATFTEDERAHYRALTSTIGNLALLEQPLNIQASNKPFAEKRSIYRNSHISSMRALSERTAWDGAAIEARTEELTAAFLRVWARPSAGDDEQPEFLVPILDAPRKTGYYDGWATEYEYVKWGNEIWEVRNVRELIIRVIRRLWQTNRDHVIAYASNDGPIHAGQGTRTGDEPISDSYFLNSRWFPQYHLGALQEILADLDMADAVFIKYAAADEA
jgi:Protein of unknown function DUF262/Protein of unknown function (DUF1524)